MEFNSDFKYDLSFGVEGESWFKELFECELGTIEVKTDRKANETGNIYIEFQSRGKPSGIATSQSDYWVYKTNDFAFIFETEKLKAKIKLLYKQGKATIKKGGDNNTSVGLLISIKDLL